MLDASASLGFQLEFLAGVEHGSDATGKLSLGFRIVMPMGVFAI
jgi:hypothetical protein